MRVPRDEKWMSIKPASGRLPSILNILISVFHGFSLKLFQVRRMRSHLSQWGWDKLCSQTLEYICQCILGQYRSPAYTCPWHQVRDSRNSSGGNCDMRVTRRDRSWTKIGSTFGPYIFYYMSLRKGDAVLSADKLIIKHDRRSSAPNYPNFPYQHKIVSN